MLCESFPASLCSDLSEKFNDVGDLFEVSLRSMVMHCVLETVARERYSGPMK